jgi:mannosyltransferase OCH1-like enzyme
MKKIHQIYISDNDAPPSDYVANQMQKLKHMYRDYEYVLYNNEMCRDQIRSLLGSKSVNSYDSLNSYSFRADLARYCILYQHGGFYFDSVICPQFKLEFDDYSVLYYAPLGACAGLRAIDNGVMCFNKLNHPFLNDAISRSISNIRKQSYGVNPLDITGPVMLGRLKSYDIRFGQSIFLDEEQQAVYGTDKAAYFEDVMHWLYKPTGFYLRTFKCVGINSYEQMWFDRKIYNKT